MPDHYRLIETPLRQTGIFDRTAFTNPGFGIVEATVRVEPLRTEELSLRALHDVVLGVIAKAAQRQAGPDLFSFPRDHRIDAAAFEPGIDLAEGIAGISRDRCDPAPCDLLNRIDLSFELVLVCRTGWR